MNFALWLPVFAAFFGALTHALSEDGGGSVLAKFGVTWAIPKWLLGPLVIATGCAAGVFENVQQGLPWQEAAAKGVLASFAAVFGVLTSQYTTGRETPPAGPSKLPLVLCLIGAVVLAGSVSACAAFQKAEPFLPTPGALACVATDVEKGISDPLTIVGDCPQLAQVAIADIEALVVDLLAAKKAAHRAAAEHGAQACDDLRDAGAPVKTLNFANDNDAGRK